MGSLVLDVQVLAHELFLLVLPEREVRRAVGRALHFLRKLRAIERKRLATLILLFHIFSKGQHIHKLLFNILVDLLSLHRHPVMLVLFGRRKHGLGVDLRWCYIITAPILLFSIAVDKPDVACLRAALASGGVFADVAWVVGRGCFFGVEDGALGLLADAD